MPFIPDDQQFVDTNIQGGFLPDPEVVLPKKDDKGKAEKILGGIASVTGGGKITKAIAELSADPTQSIVNQALSANDLVNQAKKLPTKDPRRRQLLEQAANLSGSASAQAEQRLSDLPTQKQVLADTAQLGTTLAGAGMGVAKATTAGGRILETGSKIGGLSAISGGAEAFGQGKGVGDIAKQAAVTGGVGFGFGAGAQAITELATLLSSPEVAGSLYDRALGLNKKTIEKGRSPSQRLLAEGIGGSKKGMYEKTSGISRDLDKQIDKILETSKKTFSSKEVKKQIQDELQNKFQNSLSADDIKSIVDRLPINKLNSTTKISARDLNALRSELDNNFLGSTKWLGESTSERVLGLKTATNVMRGLVKGTDPRLDPLFSRWSDMITASRSLKSELAKPHIMSNALELIASGLIGGQTGGSIPEKIKDTLLMFLTINAYQSGPVKTGIARSLFNAGKVGRGPTSQATRGLLKTLAPGITKELTTADEAKQVPR